MEEVLEVYRLPHDPRYPVVCMDESSKQLVGEVAPPIPMAPGQIQIADYIQGPLTTDYTDKYRLDAKDSIQQRSGSVIIRAICNQILLINQRRSGSPFSL